MNSPSALYISIPFCNKICPFCSFAVIRDDPYKHRPYIEMIRKEFRLLISQREFVLSEFQSIYFGGGTPSRLSPVLLSSFVDWLHQTLPISSKAHWSIEVNPEDITASVAQNLSHLGFSRVSIGVQSFQTEGLRQLGRIHHPQQSRDAIKHLRQAGFKDINLDLLFGYPGQTLENLNKDLDEFILWDPSHISIYGLTIEEKTKFARIPYLAKWQRENELLISQMYEIIAQSLTQHRLIHYEISNFAKPGFESMQNIIYWSGKDYLSLGLGAHSLVYPHRWGNYKRWVDYRKSLELNQLPIQVKERLSLEEEMNEALMIKLRTIEGLNLNEFSVNYQLDLENRWKEKIHGLLNSQLITIEDDQLKLTLRGKLLADEITASLASLLP